jgi:hypothetical protein
MDKKDAYIEDAADETGHPKSREASDVLNNNQS